MGKAEEVVLAESRYTGTIAFESDVIPIAFRLSAGADSRLNFELDPLDPKAYFPVLRYGMPAGGRNPPVILQGRTDDGKSVRSEHATVSGFQSGSKGHILGITTLAATITVPLEKPVLTPCMKLWFRSFKSYRNPVIETPLGKMSVYGASESDGIDDMSGNVLIVANDANPGPQWRDQADAFLQHMHRGLSFAHGGRLQTPRLDFAEGAVWEATFYDGQPFQKEFAVQHQLNHGPIIQALVDRFFKQGPLPDMLWTALGWMQTQTSFDEVRFLTAMTALEAISESQLPAGKGTLISKVAYQQLRSQFEDLIKAQNFPADIEEKFIEKVRSLNSNSFREKIAALFSFYGVPMHDFSDEIIRDLVNVRNDIVHRGIVPKDKDIWPHIVLVRELIARILLKEIGFKGRYCCYIGGYHDRDFPECTVAHKTASQ